MRERTRDLLIRAGALAVLLGVVAPNVTYVGHWPLAGHTHGITDEASASEHAAHCHLGPSKCSGQTDFTGTWWAGQEPMVLAPAPREELVPQPSDAASLEPPAYRLLQPPRPS
jgi:hypothetical protein